MNELRLSTLNFAIRFAFGFDELQEEHQKAPHRAQACLAFQ